MIEISFFIAGVIMLTSYINNAGFSVPRERLRASMHRVDEEGCQNRSRRLIPRY